MNTDPMRSCRHVDPDQLAEDFAKWQGRHQDLILQNSNLQEELNTLINKQEQDEITAKSAEEELKRLRGIMASLQDTLVKRCDVEDENRSLKEKINSMEETIRTVREDDQAALVQMEAHLVKVHADKKDEMEETHRQHIKQMEKECSVLQQCVGDRSAEVRQLQLQLTEAEKDKQTEIVKLRLEYDAKLLKLQSASARTSLQRSDKPSSSASSLIFREKMLNAQAASEREIASLRQTVSELKRKLDSRQHSSNAKWKH